MMIGMNDFWKRVEKLYSKDLTRTWLAKETGITLSTLSGWKQKDRLPPVDRAARIARALGVSVEYLVFGEETDVSLASLSQGNPEPMITSTALQVYTLFTEQRVINVPMRSQRLAIGVQEQILKNQNPEKVLPVLEQLVTRYDKDKLHVIEVKGDSMTGAQLFNGDLVVFAEDQIEGDGLYVISIDHNAYVKRLEFDPIEKNVIIHSENSRYTPKVVPQDLDTVKIEGKVVGWYHNHPY